MKVAVALAWAAVEGDTHTLDGVVVVRDLALNIAPAKMIECVMRHTEHARSDWKGLDMPN